MEQGQLIAQLGAPVGILVTLLVTAIVALWKRDKDREIARLNERAEHERCRREDAERHKADYSSMLVVYNEALVASTAGLVELTTLTRMHQR